MDSQSVSHLPPSSALDADNSAQEGLLSVVTLARISPSSSTFTYVNGRVEVGQYNMGKDIGEGARWSSDRRTAWRLKDGNKGDEISLAEAAQIAGRLGLPVPP